MLVSSVRSRVEFSSRVHSRRRFSNLVSSDGSSVSQRAPFIIPPAAPTTTKTFPASGCCKQRAWCSQRLAVRGRVHPEGRPDGPPSMGPVRLGETHYPSLASIGNAHHSPFTMDIETSDLRGTDPATLTDF